MDRDLTHQRFGRLVVEELDHISKYRRYWKCKCDCKKTVIVREDSLLKYTRSCGCLIDEARKNLKGKPLKHGLNGSRIQRIYKGMKQRCYNPNNHGYGDYGGRGIRICEEWLGENGLCNFYDWAIANGYREDLSIDRIENDGDYKPSNCRWATNHEQRANQRKKIYELDGITHTIQEWSKLTGIKYDTLLWRFNQGWSAKKALSRTRSTR